MIGARIMPAAHKAYTMWPQSGGDCAAKIQLTKIGSPNRVNSNVQSGWSVTYSVWQLTKLYSVWHFRSVSNKVPWTSIFAGLQEVVKDVTRLNPILHNTIVTFPAVVHRYAAIGALQRPAGKRRLGSDRVRSATGRTLCVCSLQHRAYSLRWASEINSLRNCVKPKTLPGLH